MDEMNISKSKRRRSNKDCSNLAVNQNFCEDQNSSKNIVCEKGSINSFKADNRNTIYSHDYIVWKSFISDGEVRSFKNKIQSQGSNKSFCEKKNYNTSSQKKRKFSEQDSIDDKFEQNKASYRNSIDLHKDTHKSITDYGEGILEEIDENIFKLSKEYSLAHCVAEDLRMGAGIAVDFKRIFGGVGTLVDQKLKIGNVGIVKRHDQYAFYIVTKKYSNGKPTMKTMEKALCSLLNIMKKHNLTKLGIPKIGCGLDKLDWSDIRSLIIDTFSGSGIHITVCVPSKLLDNMKAPPRLKVYITPNNLWEMEAETIIILFIDLEEVCDKNWTNYIIDKVDAKYPFKQNLLKYVKHKKLEPGNITCYTVHDEVIVCMFISQNAYYSSLENGFKSIDRKIKKYKYIAIQSGPLEPSDNFKKIAWTVLILRSVVIRSSELWLCGDVKQTTGMVYDQYCKHLYSSMNYSFQ
ncbi:uncharacterized protein LOC100162846 isoform X2 [Acyrthosiphon pisum]|nr:uncharacterized protein LOC100162846 isoform X2 [Acyrthosiphon pisum]|eukprot:XP_001946380.2 PREDICTED: uncharacterized protein LOC100162846 isoform X2 [Acyrthosiphon pisum]